METTKTSVFILIIVALLATISTTILPKNLEVFPENFYVSETVFSSWNTEIQQNFVFLASVILKSHATKHSEADLARECLTNKNKYLFYNETTNRFAVVCFIPEIEKWGIVILEKVGENFEEVTSFVKNKFKNLCQVIQYMANTKYFPSNFYCGTP